MTPLSRHNQSRFWQVIGVAKAPRFRGNSEIHSTTVPCTRAGFAASGSISPICSLLARKAITSCERIISSLADACGCDWPHCQVSRSRGGTGRAPGQRPAVSDCLLDCEWHGLVRPTGARRPLTISISADDPSCRRQLTFLTTVDSIPKVDGRMVPSRFWVVDASLMPL